MGGKLKIGITCYPTFGGSGVIATELGLALAEAGHEVHFVSSRLPVRLQSQAFADVSFHEVNTYTYALFQHSPYTLALAAKMAEVAENFELDLLHVHYAIPHAISGHLAREMLGGKIKLVTTLHGTDITLVGNDPSLHKITKFAIEQSDAVTAVSQWLRRETAEQFNPRVEIDVIRNFVDTELFSTRSSEEFRGQRHCQGEFPQLIHVSNFRPVKRAPDAVDVLKLVLERHDARLLMVGDGPDLSQAMQRARQFGVMDKVRFLGNREDVACLLAASDICLVPSESESFGLAALEAMSSGCAVVATDIGGLPELIDDGRTGYLSPLGDTQAMADRVIALLSEPQQLERIKQAARESAVSQFNIDAVLPEYLAVYERVLGRKIEPVAAAAQ